MDAREAGERIERELLILTRNRETSTPRGVRDGGALDRSAYVLLTRLEAQGPMSIPDFVEAFGFNASTFTRQTSALLRDGVRRGRIVTTLPADRPRRGAVRREDAHYVYRRTGLPCRVCGTPVATAPLATRNLYWCPTCQAA